MANIMEMGKNPNYLGSYDLYDLNIDCISVTIKAFREEDVVNNGQKEKCAVMYFEEAYKPMIINPTNKKTLARLFHSVMSEKLVGKRVNIGIEKVKAFGKIHDALRIKDNLPEQTKAKNEKCEQCGNEITAMSNMSSAQMAKYTKSKYGKALCADCAMKAKESAENVSAE